MYLNFHNIAKAHRFPAVIKLLAREFVEGATYFTLGKWLEQLSVYDLDMLLEQFELVNTDDKAGELIVLLTEMIAAGEGLDDTTTETCQQRTGYLIMIIMCESLFRKDAIEFDRSACSLGEEMLYANIAWPKGTERPPANPKRPTKGP